MIITRKRIAVRGKMKKKTGGNINTKKTIVLSTSISPFSSSEEFP
jgi:hypothetical protein